MTSPPRLRRSPKRRALHERSDSHANEIAAPTLRVVGDSNAKVYASTPFPTTESQVLSPRGRTFDHGVSVSDASQPTAATLQVPRTPDPIYAPGRRQLQNFAHDGSDSELSKTDTESPSSHLAEKPSQTTESPSNIGVDRLDMDGGIVHDEERASDEIIQLPSVYGSRLDRGLRPAPIPPNNDNRASLRAIASVASQLSLDSNESSDTVVRKAVRGPPPRGSYALFPHQHQSGSSKSRNPTPPRLPDAEANRVSFSPVSSTSPTSPVSPLSTESPSLSPESPHFPVPPARVYQPAFHAGSHNPAAEAQSTVQYPVVRVPVASGSFARPHFNIPRRPLGMSDPTADELRNSHLSTIHSEGTDERSSAGAANRETIVSSLRSSVAVDGSSISSYYPAIPPQPLFGRPREVTSSSIRVVDEEGDTVSTLPSPVRRGQGFFDLNAANRDSWRNSHYSAIRAGAGSRGSFLRDSIPAWARIYYAHEGRNLRPISASDKADSRPQTRESRSSIAYGLFRTRTGPRPREIATASSNRDSMAISPVHNPEVVAEVQGSPRQRVSPSWSPHLWHDRRSAMDRRTIFIAPSIDEAAEGKTLTRRNFQVWMFVAGFLFTPAWIIAAFLPLPPKPRLTPPASPTEPNLAHDIEKALGPLDQARYENARYWRIMNRIMSVVGILIIIAIIVLAVVGARRSS
ncbi:hypothetical protein MMC13_001544 [Lambiella insularis]|nr:hypothetical protein [Lambiella insularis]